MKKIAFGLALAAVACLVHAQVAQEPTPLQQLQTTCSFEAGVRELQGAERKQFVDGCVAAGRQRQQQVRSRCMHEAAGKTPQQWRDFMRECERR